MQYTKDAYILTATPVQVSEGYGAKALRLVGHEKPRYLDPIVLLDHFSVSQPSGFPGHPHRGFQLLTYALEGEMWHEDSLGNRVVLAAGEAALTTAGKGILHSLVPASSSCEGIEIWLNMPSSDKLKPPSFNYSQAWELPVVTGPGHKIKVVSGCFQDVISPIQSIVDCVMLDVTIEAEGNLRLPEFADYNLLMYVVSGSVHISNTMLSAGQYGELRSLPSVLPVSSKDGGRLLVFAGKPLGEPIVRQGPFVMASRSEVMKAARDFGMGVNGFEGMGDWQSQSERDICSL